MKKLLLFFILTAILISCSNDEKPYSDDNLILPKTILYTYPNSPEDNYKVVMTYNINKIISMDRGNYIIKFIYDGDLIRKQLRFNVDSQGKETKVRETIYTYSNGKLINNTSRVNFSESQPNGADFVKSDYVYNQDGTVSFIQYMPNSTDIDYKGVLTYKDNNLIKREINVVSIPDYGYEIDIYEYDTKNNPFKNILGLDLILQEIDGYGSNNVLKLTRTIKDKPSVVIQKTDYLYNDDNYPVRDNSVIDILDREYTLRLDYTY